MFEKDLYNLLFNDDVLLNWDKKSYKFDRKEKDMNPFSTIEDETSTTIIHNVLGIDKKDLKITIKNENGTILIVEGTTEDSIIKGKKYSISSTFKLDSSRLDFSNITCTMKNGLLYISIPKKQETLKTFNVKII